MAFEDFETGVLEFAPARVPEGTYYIKSALFRIGQADEYAWCNAVVTVTDPDDHEAVIGDIPLRFGYMTSQDGKTLNFVPSPDGKKGNPSGLEGYKNEDAYLRIAAGKKGKEGRSALELTAEDLEHYTGHFLLARRGFRYMPGELEQFLAAFNRLTGLQVNENLGQLEGFTMKFAFEPVAGSARPKKGEKEAQAEKEVLVPVQLVSEPGSKKAATKVKAKAAEEDDEDDEPEAEPEPKKKSTTKSKKSGPTEDDIESIEKIVKAFLTKTPGEPVPMSKWLQNLMDNVEPSFLPIAMSVATQEWSQDEEARPWFVDEDSGGIYVKKRKTA
jgi:hypothetical protein